MKIFEGVDGCGVCGSILHYTLFFFLMGSSLLAFFYFWRRGRLDLDESPKYQMMQDEER